MNNAYKQQTTFFELMAFNSAADDKTIVRTIFNTMSIERIENINPDRIQWCLDDSGISLEQLAEGTRISLASLEKVMDGTLGLTYKQLKRIGDYFGRGALFYLETGEVDNTKIRSTEFRSLLNQQYAIDKKIKQIIQLAEWHREIYIDLLEEMDRDDLIKFSPPDIARLTIPQVATKASKYLDNLKVSDLHKLGRSPVAN